MTASPEITSDFLAHYGVKGMRWGIRNRKEPVKISNDAKRADYALKKVNPKIQTQYKPLSNNALKDLKTRLQLEADLKKLMPDPEPAYQKKISAGQKHVAFILGAGLTVNQVIRFSKTPAGKALMNRIIPRPGGKHYNEGRHFG